MTKHGRRVALGTLAVAVFMVIAATRRYDQPLPVVALVPEPVVYSHALDKYFGPELDVWNVPLPRPRPPMRVSSLPKQPLPTRVLEYSCEQVRWAVANLTHAQIVSAEQHNAKQRGLTQTQRIQQRDEAIACLTQTARSEP